MMDMINNSEKLCRISIMYCSISKQSVDETARSMWYWLNKTMRIFDNLKTIDIHSQMTTQAISLSQKVLSPSCNQAPVLPFSLNNPVLMIFRHYPQLLTHWPTGNSHTCRLTYTHRLRKHSFWRTLKFTQLSFLGQCG